MIIKFRESVALILSEYWETGYPPNEVTEQIAGGVEIPVSAIRHHGTGFGDEFVDIHFEDGSIAYGVDKKYIEILAGKEKL